MRRMDSMGGLPFFRGSRSSRVNWWLRAFTAWETECLSPRTWMPSPSRPLVSCSCRWTTARALRLTARWRSSRRALTARQVMCSTEARTQATAFSWADFTLMAAENSLVKSQQRRVSPLASRYSTRMSHTPSQRRVSSLTP